MITFGSEMKAGLQKGQLSSEVYQDAVPIVQQKSDVTSRRIGAGEMDRGLWASRDI